MWCTWLLVFDCGCGDVCVCGCSGWVGFCVGVVVSGLYGRQTTSGLRVGCVVLDLMVVG